MSRLRSLVAICAAAVSRAGRRRRSALKARPLSLPVRPRVFPSITAPETPRRWRRGLPLAVLAGVWLVAGSSTAQGAGGGACDAAAAYNQDHGGVALIIQLDGRVVCERYAASAGRDAGRRLGRRLRQRRDSAPARTFGPDTPVAIYSGSKSFSGLVAAAAVQDGLLRLDERVADAVPEWRADPRLARVTIRQLLSLTSGVEVGRPASGARVTFEAALRARSAYEPGARFAYGPNPFQIFGGLMTRKLAAAGRGETYLDYLDRRVLAPAGVRVTAWQRAEGSRDPNLADGATITAREWLEFGEFIRGGGAAGGGPVVDPDAFEALFQGSTANPGYGLTWWLGVEIPPATAAILGRQARVLAVGAAAAAGRLPGDIVIAGGFTDQRLYVSRDARVVIVRLTPGERPQGLAELRAARDATWSDADFLELAFAAVR